MRTAWLVLGLSGTMLCSCATEPKAPPVANSSENANAPKPSDESDRFPKANLAGTKVVGRHLMSKAFMPGGTVAHYRRGALEYDLFAARLPSATEAAILLPDWRKAMTGVKLIPSFGGYFGADAGVPVFVFAKREWIAGVAGLPLKDADAQARILAASLR